MKTNIDIDESLLDKIRGRLYGEHASLDVLIKDAMTLYAWAIEESANGRDILSADQKRMDLMVIQMTSLRKVRPLINYRSKTPL